MLSRVRLRPCFPRGNSAYTGFVYNRCVHPKPARDGADPSELPSASRALAGFLLSGLLFGFLGAILPAWGYHATTEFGTVGNFFLSMGAGVVIGTDLAARMLPRQPLIRLLTFSCFLACAALLYLGLIPPLAHPFWRAGGLLAMGFAAGSLNTALFQAIAPAYDRDPAATVNVGGIFFGLGCLLLAVLVAGTFYAYTLPSILVLIAVIPGFFAVWYSRSTFPAPAALPPPTLAQTLQDFRNFRAVLFALLLFFQFGNEWSIAGWLPIFLIRRLGVSPSASLIMLAMYWLFLLLGRLAAVGLLPRIRHGRILVMSAGAALFGCVILLATNNVPGAMVGLFLVGGGFATIYPLATESIGHRFRYSHPARFSGIFSLALTGGMTAPWVLGHAAQVWGVGAVMGFPLIGTCLVFALILLIWLEAKLSGDAA